MKTLKLRRWHEVEVYLLFARPDGSEIGDDHLIGVVLDEGECFRVEKNNPSWIVGWEERLVKIPSGQTLMDGDSVYLTYDMVRVEEGTDGRERGVLDSGSVPLSVIHKSSVTKQIEDDNFILKVPVGSVNMHGVGTLC